VTAVPDESPAERLARWSSTDAAIGLAAEAEQLLAQLNERRAEADDLRARIAHLSSRVAQVEADNADLRRAAKRVSPLALARTSAQRFYRRARAAVGRRLRR
jgi:chromosome segregation ATPase